MKQDRKALPNPRGRLVRVGIFTSQILPDRQATKYERLLPIFRVADIALASAGIAVILLLLRTGFQFSMIG